MKVRKINLEGYGVNEGKGLELVVNKVTPKVVILEIPASNGLPATVVRASRKTGIMIGREDEEDGFKIPEDVLEALASEDADTLSTPVIGKRITRKSVEPEPEPEEDEEGDQDEEEDTENEDEEEGEEEDDVEEEDSEDDDSDEEESDEDEDTEEEDEDSEEDNEEDDLEVSEGDWVKFQLNGRELEGEVLEVDEDEEEIVISRGKRQYTVSFNDILEVEHEEETQEYVFRITLEGPEDADPKDVQHALQNALNRASLEADNYSIVSVIAINEGEEEMRKSAVEKAPKPAVGRKSGSVATVEPKTTAKKPVPAPVVEKKTSPVKSVPGKVGRPRETPERPTAGKGQTEIRVSRGLYANILENGLKKGTNSPEKSAFGKAWKAATEENNYFYVILDKATATHFINVVLVALVKTWEGVSGGAFRRGAKPIIGELASTFKISLRNLPETLLPEDAVKEEEPAPAANKTVKRRSAK